MNSDMQRPIHGYENTTMTKRENATNAVQLRDYSSRKSMDDLIADIFDTTESFASLAISNTTVSSTSRRRIKESSWYPIRSVNYVVKTFDRRNHNVGSARIAVPLNIKLQTV